MIRRETVEKDIDEVEDIFNDIESSLQGYKVLDGDEETIILKSEKSGCDFEIIIRKIQYDENQHSGEL